MNAAVEFLKKHIGKDSSLSPSPLMRWLNPVILFAEEGKLSFEYKVRKEMTNPLGAMHGGISAAIIDDAIGAAVYSLGEEQFYSTINLAVDYFGRAPENETVIADALILKKGRQLVNAQCEIWNADKSRLIARGYSNLIKTEMNRKEEVSR